MIFKTKDKYPDLYKPRGKYGVFIGKEFKSNLSGIATIIDMDDKVLANFLVKFHDTGNIILVRQIGQLSSGSFLDKKYGVGFNSKHTYPAKYSTCFDKWSRMLQRAYNGDYKNSHNTYNNVEVDKKWHDYQNFAEWYFRQVGNTKYKFDLDKDLLCIGNKTYSEKYCCLLPQEINIALVERGNRGYIYHKRDKVYESSYRGKYLGRSCDYSVEQLQNMYLNERNLHIKNLANKYRGIISSRAYNSLINLRFGIVDGFVVRLS